MASLNSIVTYGIGECTQFVADALSWVPHNWGNAGSWGANAQAQGYTVSKNPTIGSVAWWGYGQPGQTGAGHVAVVTGISSNNVQVTEMNSVAGWNRVDTRWLDSTSLHGISGFITPPGSGAGSSSNPNNNWWNKLNPAAGIPVLGVPGGSPTPSNVFTGTPLDFFSNFGTNMTHLAVVFGLILLALLFVGGGLATFVLQSGASRKL